MPDLENLSLMVAVTLSLITGASLALRVRLARTTRRRLSHLPDPAVTEEPLPVVGPSLHELVAARDDTDDEPLAASS